MIKENFFGTNSTMVFLPLLLFGALFAGCAKPTVTSNAGANAANAPVNKKDETTNKNGAAESAARNKEILRDFRKVSDDKSPTFSREETDAVLKYLLGDGWDKDLEITSRVQGAFTKPNAKETLYFVTGCEDESGKFVSNTTCGHVGWDTAGWLAVYDGTTPVLKIKQSLGSGIVKATDVNGDGISEILSFGGYAGMGIVTEGSALGQISGGKFQVIESFDGSASDCASALSKDKKAVAAVIGYTPPTNGKMPDFSEEYFQTKCEGDDIGENPQWEKITKKQFDDFYKSNS